MNDAQLLALAKQYLTLKKQIRLLENELKDTELAIKRGMGDERERTFEGIRVSITPYTTHHFDSKTFAVDAPAVYKQYLLESKRTRFCVQ